MTSRIAKPEQQFGLASNDSFSESKLFSGDSNRNLPFGDFQFQTQPGTLLTCALALGLSISEQEDVLVSLEAVCLFVRACVCASVCVCVCVCVCLHVFPQQ